MHRQSHMQVTHGDLVYPNIYRVVRKNGTVEVFTVDFSGLCSNQELCLFTLLDKISFPYYNNTKIIKFGWELFLFYE